jgi:FKBP-type peptidyl-prolyl cis-trans isomerase FklB
MRLNFIFAYLPKNKLSIKILFMKKIALCCVLSFLVVTMQAQNNTVKKTVKPAPKTVATFQLKTLEDSANYAMGLSIANFYRQEGITKINSAIITRAINDVLNGRKVLMNDMQANNCMMSYINQQQLLKSKPNIDAGEKFLAENKKKPGVMTTASGLQYEVITQGTGPKPSASDTVVCNYKGTFLNGEEFDNSYKRGEPAEFPVSHVIKGWTEVLQLMPVGSKYKVYVPYQLGYGGGDYNGIPGGSLLIFEIELLEIKK